MINEWIGFLPFTKKSRMLEVGSELLSTSSVVSQNLNITMDSLTVDSKNFNLESLILKETYDYMVVPKLFNQLTKTEIFSAIDALLEFTNDAIFILLNEGESKEPLFIPDFSEYDISYYDIETNQSLIKVHKQIKQLPPKACVLHEELPYKSLRILYILPHKNLTGGLKMLYEQMKSLQKRGHQIKVLIRGAYEQVVPDWVEDFIPDEEIVIKAYESYTRYFQDVDLVFAGFYNQINELENDKVPVLYWEQGHEALYGDVKDKNLESQIRKSLTQEFSRDIYLATDSQYVHDIVKSRFNRDSYILPIFIDTDFYYPLATKSETESLTVLLVGNPFLSFKGFKKALTVLLNAWNQGHRFHVEWACQVKPTLGPLPFDISYHENVSQSELAAVYRQADVLLTCSLYEGCPMPPLEAMASKVAVVTTNSGGVNQYATHGENALIAFSNTIEELTTLLVTALTNEALRKSLIEAGYKTATSLNYENGSILLEKILLATVADYQLRPVEHRKKVLFMIGTLLGGGAEKVLCDWVKELDKGLFDITVQTVFDQGIYIEDVKQFAKYKTIFKTSAYSEVEAKQLLEYQQYLKTLSDEDFSREVIKEVYDIEIAFLEDQSTKIIAHSPNKQSRKIAWVHTNLITEPGSKQFYENHDQQKACYEKYHDIVFVSKGAKEAFIEKFQFTRNFHVIYNPIHTKSLLKLAEEPVEATLESTKFKLIAVGRLMPVKGFDRLLIAHRQLIQDGFDYELWILGDGPYREAFENFIQEHQLTHSVKLLGFKQNPYPYIAQANLLVCSSLAEGFSLAVAEALALGIPVLTTQCEGPVELLEDGKYGLVVENNVESLYQGIRHLFTNTLAYYQFQQAVKDWRAFDSTEVLKKILLQEAIVDEDL